jgi:uncharacterized protein HemX
MTFVLLAIAALTIFAVGYFFGREQMLRSLNKRIEEAYQRGKAEVEAEKQKLAGDIRDRLVDLKGSLKSTVAAYESTTRVLRSALSISTESRTAISSPAFDKDLALEFFEEPAAAPPASDAPPADLVGPTS